MTALPGQLADGSLDGVGYPAVVVPAPKPAQLDLRSLHRAITGLVHQHAGREGFLAALVEFVRQLTNASVVAWFQTDAWPALQTGPRSIVAGHEAAADDLEQLLQWAAKACARQELMIHQSPNGRAILATPVAGSNGHTEALAAVLWLGSQSIESFVVILQLVVGHVALWDAHRRAADLDQEAANSAAILELVGTVARVEGAGPAAQCLADVLLSHLNCEQVAIGLALPGRQTCRLTAISGAADVDPQSESGRLLEAVLTESLLRDAPGIWPPHEDLERHLLLAHERLSSECRDALVYSSPLRNAEGEPAGAWVFVSRRDAPVTAQGERFIQACSDPIGACLDLVQRAGRAGRFARWLDAAKRRPWFRSKFFWITIAIAVAGLALPLRYRVACKCQLEPVTKRFVAAAHDGLFEKSLVKPGDIVRRDQVLGRLDGRELRWEMAGLIADEGRAAKSRDVNMATNKIAAAQIDALEMERLSHKRRLLEYRIDHLDIKSPIDGVIISGDLQRSEGVPVTVGQALYEIAPLGRMVAEIAINDEDRSYVEEGQAVTVRLEAYPGQSWSGRLTRINPRSEERDERNVFIGELALENDSGLLRPGMKGRAKIDGPRTPLAWLLLRKPCNALLRWIGW